MTTITTTCYLDNPEQSVKATVTVDVQPQEKEFLSSRFTQQFLDDCFDSMRRSLVSNGITFKTDNYSG